MNIKERFNLTMKAYTKKVEYFVEKLYDLKFYGRVSDIVDSFEEAVKIKQMFESEYPKQKYRIVERVNEIKESTFF